MASPPVVFLLVWASEDLTSLALPGDQDWVSPALLGWQADVVVVIFISLRCSEGVLQKVHSLVTAFNVDNNPQYAIYNVHWAVVRRRLSRRALHRHQAKAASSESSCQSRGEGTVANIIRSIIAIERMVALVCFTSRRIRNFCVDGVANHLINILLLGRNYLTTNGMLWWWICNCRITRLVFV